MTKRVKITVKLADELRKLWETGLRYVPAGPGQSVPKRPPQEREADLVAEILDRLGVRRA